MRSNRIIECLERPGAEPVAAKWRTEICWPVDDS